MKIDIHCHQIEEFFHDALKSLPGVTLRLNPDRFSYLLKDGKTWLPFRPEMFHPDHLIREMDRKGIDMSVISMNTPSVYIFEARRRILFGTDYPFIISDPSYVEALDLPEEQKQMIFSGNATRLFEKRFTMGQA